MKVVFESEAPARLVLSYMKEIIGKFVVVTQEDLKNLIGETTDYRDHKVGWVNLDDAEVKDIDGEITLVLSEPKEIKEIDGLVYTKRR